MKFRNEVDANLFLIEVGSFDKYGKVDESYQPSEKEEVAFLKKRSPLQDTLIKDAKKKGDQKANWRRNRRKIMKGIHAYHKSNDGKRFHRKLGRFLASREGFKGQRELRKDESIDLQISLSSLRTRALLSSQFYRSVDESVDFEIFLGELQENLPQIEARLLACQSLDESQRDFLFSLLDESAIAHVISSEYGASKEEVLGLCEAEAELNYDTIKKIIETVAKSEEKSGDNPTDS